MFRYGNKISIYTGGLFMEDTNRMKLTIVFIILHYGDTALTKRTVDSVKQLEQIDKAKIVIVQNGPINQSDTKLEDYFQDEENVEIVYTIQNVGFSAGNNNGYQYAKTKFEADFFVVLNNDILFPDKEFIPKLYMAYNASPFYVAGPDVFVPGASTHANPAGLKLVDKEDVIYEIKRNKKIIEECNKPRSNIIKERYRYDIIDVGRNNWKSKMKSRIKKLLGTQSDTSWKNTAEGFLLLNGSCLIFDKRFISIQEKAFSPETFLYGEEAILQIRCSRLKYNMAYLPSLKVIHTCQGSLKASRPSYEEYCEKTIQSATRTIEAMEILKEYILYQ